MSLVDPDWQAPAAWLGARAAWGVTLDGGTLRCARMTANGKTESMAESLEVFASGSDLRTRIQQDRKRGIPVVVGIEPHRLMIRELTSPIADPRKADEIWLTLFDAAIPFALESCRVALLLREPGAEGRRCLAVGIRRQDLQSLRAEWGTRGLEPDLAVPEPLLTSPDRKSRVWCGEQRTVWSLWRDRQFLGAGGVEVLEAREKTLARQSAAHGLQLDQLDRIGPGAGSESHWLEVRLAKAALKSDTMAVNLLEREETSDGVRNRWDRRVRQVQTLGVLLLILLIVLPFLPGHLIRVKREQLEKELDPVFERVVGYAPPAVPPGHKLIDARQILAQEWTPLQAAWERMRKAGPTYWLAWSLDQAQEAEVEVEEVHLTGRILRMKLQGREEKVKAFASTLEQEGGWSLSPLESKQEDWVLQGEWP